MNDIYNGLKIFFKQFLKYYLKFITKLVLLIHRPMIIGVSGSSNVFFTKEEIRRQLAENNIAARSNPKNFNTEIGLPLAMLNLPAGYNSYLNWLPIIWLAFKSIFTADFPKVLVLAMGASKPGDMKYLMSLAKPDIGVITDITQRYIESFDDIDELVGEYELFVKSIRKNGYLILNGDNQRIKNLSRHFNNSVFYFGSEKSELKNYWRGEAERQPDGQTIKVASPDGAASYQIRRFGQHHIYALLAGLIVKQILIKK